MKREESLMEKDYRLIRNTILFSLIPSPIRNVIGLVMGFFSIVVILLMYRFGVLGDVLGLFGSLFDSVFKLIKGIFQLVICAFTGNACN